MTGINTLIYRYLATPCATDSALNDPMYAAHVAWLRGALQVADGAMQAEGVSEEARERIRRR
jgi:hypothetical protein